MVHAVLSLFVKSASISFHEVNEIHPALPFHRIRAVERPQMGVVEGDLVFGRDLTQPSVW